MRAANFQMMRIHTPVRAPFDAYTLSGALISPLIARPLFLRGTFCFTDQKPSSARPTQLKANRQQTTAATDAKAASALTGAKVASAFAEDMIQNPSYLTIELCRMTFAQKWREFAGTKKREGCGWAATESCLPAKTRNRLY